MRVAGELTEAIRTIGRLERENNALHKEIAELRRHAHEDALTGIGNKRAFLIEFEGAVHAYRRDYPGTVPFSVVVIDANNLKIINDALGHAAGDDLLRAIAKGIVSTTRTGKDFSARIGGDEFVVLIKGPADAFSIRIHKVLEAIAAKNGLGFPVSISLGSVSINEIDTEERLSSPTEKIIKSMLDIADSRMYEHKARSKNGRNPAAIASAIRP